MELTNNSYKQLRDKADSILKEHLESIGESSDFYEMKKFIMEEVDEFNTKLPGEVILDYYNYVVEKYKNK